MARDFDNEFKDNNERKYAYEFDSVVREFLLDRVCPSLNQESPLLEIGAYMGDMTAQILERFQQVTVLESSPQLCDHLQQRFTGQISLIRGAVEEVIVQDNFETIFLIHTLEHLDDPVGCLRRISQWLSPRGRLVIAVPNADALSRQIAVRMGLIESNSAVTPGEWEHGHRRTYSIDQLLRDVRQANLRIEDHGGVIVKPLSNRQFDQALELGVVSSDYVKACDELSKEYPHLAATIFVIASLQN